MNDRFKFRVPVFDEGKFLCFHFFNAIDGADHYREIGPYAHGKEEQCTGLKDKNGNLIYEGDIVKFYEHNYEAYFREDSSAIKIWNEKKKLGYSLDYHEEFEVIGNIHENPELLEGKK